jgi:hypothetical protein
MAILKMAGRSVLCLPSSFDDQLVAAIPLERLTNSLWISYETEKQWK